MIRAFVALDLPDEVRGLLAVQQFMIPLPRKVEPSLMHLTVAFLGEVPPERLEAAHERFAEVRLPPFELRLRGLGLFGGERPRAFWAGVEPSEPLTRLHDRVVAAARQAGCPVEARRFVPHVTLGRFPPPGRIAAMRLEQAVVEGAGFRAGPWMVEAFCLKQSRLGPKGPHYDDLAQYRLS
jgi:2'-5' RNA ligase